MARAMHCITNQDVWSRTRDLASQSLFPLSLISSSVSMVNASYSSHCARSLSCSGWRGLSSRDILRSLLLVSSDLRLNRWNPPMIIKNPCVIDHCTSNNELLRMIAINKINSHLNLPSFSLTIFRALKNCLMAQASTYSGTSKAQTNRGRRCSANDRSGFHIHL